MLYGSHLNLLIPVKQFWNSMVMSNVLWLPYFSLWVTHFGFWARIICLLCAHIVFGCIHLCLLAIIVCSQHVTILAIGDAGDKLCIMWYLFKVVSRCHIQDITSKKQTVFHVSNVGVKSLWQLDIMDMQHTWFDYLHARGVKALSELPV